MKFSHLLALGMIAFIVFRLTQDVRNPAAPEPERRPAVQVIERGGDPTITIRGGNGSDDNRNTESILKVLLQRLAAATAATPSAKGQAAGDWTESGFRPVDGGASPAAAGPTPLPLSPREKLRLVEARRPVLTKQYGPPNGYQGMLRRHLGNGKVAVGTSEVGECTVEDYEPGDRQVDGTMISFDAWSVGAETYVNAKGERRTLRRLIYAPPPLPLWDKYGRPLNRDVLPPEVVREAGIHTSTALDPPKPKDSGRP
jgi:hypothetical protein